MMWFIFFFQAEDGIRDLVRSRGLGDVYKRQLGAVLGQDAGPVRRRDALLDERQRNLPDLRAVFAPADLSLIHI